VSSPKFDLKIFRQRHDMTQDELACKLGFSRSYIATIETSRQGISIRMMYEIIRNFDVDYEDFYAHEKNR